MKLYVPHLGDELRLMTSWTFHLYNESRNDSLIEMMNLRPVYQSFLDTNDWRKAMNEVLVNADGNRWYDNAYYKKPVSIPSGTVLKVKRIFIRQGMPDFDSITFSCKLPNAQGKLKPIRFWAKLDACNDIEFEKVS